MIQEITWISRLSMLDDYILSWSLVRPKELKAHPHRTLFASPTLNGSERDIRALEGTNKDSIQNTSISKIQAKTYRNREVCIMDNVCLAGVAVQQGKLLKQWGPT